MTLKRELLRRQRSWARSAGLRVDDRGCVERYELNLRQPMAPPTLAAFEQSGEAELRDCGARPAKLRALHSSAALAVNLFDHWARHDAAPLLRALGIPGKLKSPPSFEQQFPTGLAGDPPNVDVVLELESGTVIGIESKFTEWLTPKRRSRPAFKGKYFENGARPWQRAGLPACQALADDLRSGAEFFRRLDAPQLLKHALGLATQRPGRFALWYLFYDAASPAAAQHREEIARFAARVGAELHFEAIAYQALYRALRSSGGSDPEYLAYLGSRYFSAGSTPPAAPSKPARPRR